ncbi:hypothetical protein NEUTE1DRAFT_118582 [Neurospora tetrasperma FGSC 2508]|uniref:Uncharacterized protein n=1 Tax=Neurospora tetrasperma (strain FGSC 2508 / ATCC MYA-4615 / P0657) TaxID=510951 RepID=F8MYT9_NEUT8|nr:uncharacterized protein NEUTE1DRAFT_118582 [Neurospora tetrasperma FGSC 2508]EGO51937.1 hypothetical protein NEUTE1DRAFT_118582 [Neurospora tetrasperma FGSC 2508]
MTAYTYTTGEYRGAKILGIWETSNGGFFSTNFTVNGVLDQICSMHGWYGIPVGRHKQQV